MISTTWSARTPIPKIYSKLQYTSNIFTEVIGTNYYYRRDKETNVFLLKLFIILDIFKKNANSFKQIGSTCNKI